MKEPIFLCDVYVDVFKKEKTGLKHLFKKVIKDVPVVGTENDKIFQCHRFIDMIHRMTHGHGYSKTEKYKGTVVATRIVRKDLLSYSAENAAWGLTRQERIPAILKLIETRKKGSEL